MTGLYEIKSLMSKLSGGILTEAILMEATRDEIYTQYYDENNGKVKKIPRDIFDKICEIGDVDNNPQKMSEFAKWLCDMYDTPKWVPTILQTMPSQWLKEHFRTFRKVQKIKPEGVDLNLRNYGIKSFMEKMQYVSEQGLDVSKSEIKKMGAETIYQDNEWKVVNIKSREAAMFYGKGTTWCTSSRDSSHFYEDYSKRGLLIIFINLVDKSKYQGLFDFDCTWYELKDEANEYFDETEVFPSEMFNYVTDKAEELVKIRAERVWEDESEINGDWVGKTINEFFSVYHVKRLDRYRIRNEKTGEWLETPHGNTFTDLFFYPSINFLIVEYKFGANECAFFIDGSKASLFETDMRGHMPTEIRVRDEEGNLQWGGSEYFIIRFGGSKGKILNVKERRYISIKGKDVFKAVFQVGNLLTIDTFNDVKHLYSMVKHQCVEIDGTSNFSSLVVKGYNIISVVSEKGTYFYNVGYDSYFKTNDDGNFDMTAFRNGIIISNIKTGDNPLYKLYCVNNNTFLSVDGVDTFDAFENLLYGRMIVLAKYSDEPKMWLYNTYTNNFCESENIPIDNSEIEIYNDGVLLFWGDNDILTYYDYEKNIVNSLPITIQKQDAHGENFNERELQNKELQAQRYIINDIEVNIYLLPNLKVILCKNNKTGETKRYDF